MPFVYTLCTTAVDCGLPSNITNGWYTVNATTFQLVARYQCNLGYTLQGRTDRHCLPNGTWRSGLPSCQPISCPPITYLKNGTVRGDRFIFNSFLNFTCSHGYNLFGPSSVRCQVNGTWTDDPPRCDMITCNSPGMSTGTTSQGTLMVYHSSIHYQCLQGYQKASGSDVITCQSSGNWSGSPLQCSPVPCPKLVPIANGNSSPVPTSILTFGQSATYFCNNGYLLIGDTNRTCLANGQWSTSVPRCESVLDIYLLCCDSRAPDPSSMSCVCWFGAQRWEYFFTWCKVKKKENSQKS